MVKETSGDYRKATRLSAGLGTFKAMEDAHERRMRVETREETIERVNRHRDMSKVTVLPARPELDINNRSVKKRVAIYVRVSTDGLSQVTSFNLQKKHYLKMVAARPDWELVAIYSDEGISATSTAHREGLLCLIEDAVNGKFDMVITKSLSRLSRNLMDCMRIIFGFRKLQNPVAIFFESENINSLDRTMDFAISIFSLVAQEESHKKSEAMNASYAARFGDGQYMKPDLLGYDSCGINELSVNPEEAKTLRLMYMMYNSGYTPDDISGILTELGRKTHTHVYKDGRIKEGHVKWSANSIISYLKNERRCGHVLAQKSYTSDYLSHLSKSNDTRIMKQYYAVDQHEAIIAPEDYDITQRLIMSNRGGWKGGIPELEILTGGALNGFVMTVPDWYGFEANDYNRACLRAYGINEESLIAAEKRMNDVCDDNDGIPVSEFQHVYVPDQDDLTDYEDYEDKEDDTGIKVESFSEWIERLGDAIRDNGNFSPEVIEQLDNEINTGKVMDNGSWKGHTGNPQPGRYGTLDMSGCEDIDASLVSMSGRSYVTFDRKGVTFSKRCLQRLKENQGEPDAGICLERIKIAYNAAEQVIAVMLADNTDPENKTVQWSREKDGSHSMRRCSIKGLAGAIYDNMGWNPDYKYKILGTMLETAEGPLLLFKLSRPIINVKIKPVKKKASGAEGLERPETRKKAMHDGFDPSMFEIFDDAVVGDEFAAVLDEFDVGNGPVATVAKQIARSRVQYYDDVIGKAKGNKVSISDIGDQKYEPEFIEQLLKKGIEPEEGWSYLEELVVFRDDHKGFTMRPLDKPGSFGRFADDSFRMWQRLKNAKGRSVRSPYGWTAEVDFPSKDVVQAAIEQLREETDTMSLVV